MKHKLTKSCKGNRDGGFTLIEVMIAIVVMSIGLLAVIASFATAVAATQSAQEDLIARQKALEALESIYTARNSQQLPFASIKNVASGGIFQGGALPLLCAGPDGLVGTADDVACKTAGGVNCPNGGVECMVLPGRDGVLGTADDVTMSLSNFTRTIAINTVSYPASSPLAGQTNPNMVAVTITVSYTKSGWTKPRSYTANALISSYH